MLDYGAYGTSPFPSPLPSSDADAQSRYFQNQEVHQVDDYGYQLGKGLVCKEGRRAVKGGSKMCGDGDEDEDKASPAHPPDTNSTTDNNNNKPSPSGARTITHHGFDHTTICAMFEAVGVGNSFGYKIVGKGIVHGHACPDKTDDDGIATAKGGKRRRRTKRRREIFIARGTKA